MPMHEQRLFLSVLGMLGVVGVALWLLPYPKLERLLAKPRRRSTTEHRHHRIAWAVASARRFIPAYVKPS